MKYSTICLVFLLLIASVVKADDIATIRSFLDSKTDDANVLHGVYMACLSLTRTGTEDAVPVLKQLLDDERFITVAKTALANIQPEKPEPIQRELTYDAALLAAFLQNPEKGLPGLVDALKKDSETPFKVTLRVVLELKSEATGTVVLDNMGDLPVEKQAALVRNLGVRKDTVIVPRLMELAQGDKVELQLAAVEALGETGDLRAVDILLHLAGTPVVEGTPVAELAQTASESLKLFKGEEFDKKIIALLDSDNKNLLMAALGIITERRIADASERLRHWDYLTTVSDVEIRAAAMKAFALSAPPTVENIHFTMSLFDTIQRMSRTTEDEWTFTSEALLTLCRRTADREKAVDLFATELKKTDGTSRNLLICLDCLFLLGGEKAAATLASVAMGTDDALTDKATQLLGRWTTPEVAPHLILLAEKHPSERYRSRTLSGYLRVVRQMGLPVEQKVHMAEKALSIATRDADKERATQVLDRFKAMMKGTPIFNGKTFDGWEFRNNEQWFRIEDGAIVGGTLEEPIPRNEFIVSKKEYGDFTLRIECKAIGKGCNGGVQFRSFRHPTDSGSPNEMLGYQADMTDDAAYWGALYDESRRNRFLVTPPRELVDPIFRPNDWNEYEIVCKSNNIKLFLNGTLTVDYTETDVDIPARGFIGLQIHGGAPSETWYRNIRIEEE